MKKAIFFSFFLLVLISCKDVYVDKPNNLIDENKMINILTDVAIIEAIKVENPASLSDRNIQPDKYIYKKYKIDSTQFADSDKYYASDVPKYVKMYEKVAQNIANKKAVTDSLIAKGINVGEPKVKKEKIKKEKFLPFGRIFRR